MFMPNNKNIVNLSKYRNEKDEFFKPNYIDELASFDDYVKLEDEFSKQNPIILEFHNSVIDGDLNSIIELFENLRLNKSLFLATFFNPNFIGEYTRFNNFNELINCANSYYTESDYKKLFTEDFFDMFLSENSIFQNWYTMFSKALVAFLKSLVDRLEE